MVSTPGRYHLNFYLYLIVLCYLPIPSFFHHREQNSVVETITFYIDCDGKTGQVWSCGRIVAETGLHRYKGEDRSRLVVTLCWLPGKLILRQPASEAVRGESIRASSIVWRLVRG